MLGLKVNLSLIRPPSVDLRKSSRRLCPCGTYDPFQQSSSLGIGRVATHALRELWQHDNFGDINQSQKSSIHQQMPGTCERIELSPRGWKPYPSDCSRLSNEKPRPATAKILKGFSSPICYKATENIKDWPPFCDIKPHFQHRLRQHE